MARDGASGTSPRRPGTGEVERARRSRVAHEGSPVRLRLAATSDASSIRSIYAPYVTGTYISFETEVPAIEDVKRRIGSVVTDLPWIVAESAGDGATSAGDAFAVDDPPVLGYAYAAPFAARVAYRWSVETAVYVRLGSERSGVGSFLYRALLELLGIQGYRQALAGIALPNDASVGLHEAFGFRCNGVHRAVGYKLGSWHDVGWWQRALCETTATDPPAEPAALGTLEPGRVGEVLRSAASSGDRYRTTDPRPGGGEL